jgi:hypothetical protein
MSVHSCANMTSVIMSRPRGAVGGHFRFTLAGPVFIDLSFRSSVDFVPVNGAQGSTRSSKLRSRQWRIAGHYHSATRSVARDDLCGDSFVDSAGDASARLFLPHWESLNVRHKLISWSRTEPLAWRGGRRYSSRPFRDAGLT